MNKKNGQSSTLLEEDIRARFDEEKKLVTNAHKQKNHGKATMVTISIILAIIVLSGIIYPLFQL